MSTKIYGASDNLIEFEGDVDSEFGNCPGDDEKHGTLVICSDGTLLEVKYGKGVRGIWAIHPIKKGSLFERVEICDDDEAEVYSDVALFKDGLKWAYAAGSWEKMR